jgi:aryl-alcohol dehydrogenase-like predicted oxidoreductase
VHSRRLGPLTVSAMGFGCMGLSQSYGAADPAEAEATLRRAVELGITLFDTANVYGLGHNETLVGRVLAPHREAVVLATKFGIQAGAKGPVGVEGGLEENVGALDLALSEADMDDLARVFAPDAISGARYPEGLQRLLGARESATAG